MRVEGRKHDTERYSEVMYWLNHLHFIILASRTILRVALSDLERNKQNLTKEPSLIGFLVPLVTVMKDAKGA